MNKLRELIEEFRTVFAGRGTLADSVLPPVTFVAANAVLGFDYAMWSALTLAAIITVLRFAKRQAPAYALGGLGGVGVAILIARLLDRATGFFVPAIISGAFTIILCAASIIAGKPLVAWTSYLTRRWPLGWYWHPRVRPAYTEVTAAWTVFFAMRLAVQILIFQRTENDTSTVVNLILGWPFTISLLVISYLYGLWRLQNLRGPSVEEFKAGADPPWTGQRRGF